ncbi:MAG: TraB/GumN family protein [Allosphingosinicella sp.]
MRALAIAAASLLLSAAPTPDDNAARTEDIVVTAVRSGIPVWRVVGPRTTLVLVGTIREVSPQVRWDAASLTEALRKSDRVMFPGSVRYTASILSARGLESRTKKMAVLPEGQSLSQFLPPGASDRLAALGASGLLKPGFERRHPLAVANELIGNTLGLGGGGFLQITKVRPGYGDAADYIKAAVKKYHLNLVPIPEAKLKPVLKGYLAASPADHVPCLLAAIALAEAGTGANRIRSNDWAHRRVPETLASPAQKAFDACLPEAMREEASPEVRDIVRGLLEEPEVTVAALELGALADPGGILDSLQAEGFEIRGPAWK